MAGPTEGAIFEPTEVKIQGKAGKPAECNDIVFQLKGFKLSMPVKVREADGRLGNAPAGINLNLSFKRADRNYNSDKGHVLEI
jgi:hypothetical protein